jgi:16S rRNA (uracil1498-N3)-methyltransferase
LHIFYTPDVNGDFYFLNEEESKHCIRVMRLKIGDNVLLIDGKGIAYNGEICSEHPKKCQVRILSTQNGLGMHNYYLHLAIAPTKSMDRMEWLVEKAIEIGVDEITPVICERSERREIKIDRLEKVAIVALKQSMNAFLPKINEAIRFNDWIRQDHAGLKMIAHCAEDQKQTINKLYSKGEKAIALVGPEGDFSATEIKAAIANGFEAISLGKNRLRTETAGIVICTAVQLLND